MLQVLVSPCFHMEVIGICIDLSWETTLKINSLSHPWSDFTTSITTTKDQMLQYLIDIMADANDFLWQNAKAAHAVLLCDMERGAVTWDNSDKIDRIRRAHAQRHTQNSKSWAKTSEQGNMKKPWFCKPFQNGSCTFQKDHESNGKWQRHVCATCLEGGRY